jgi:hypothetical protein
MADHSKEEARLMHPSTRASVDANVTRPPAANAIRIRGWTDADRRPVPRRLLRRFDDHAIFAYARGHDLVRRSDDTLWAHLSGDVVLSARSGKPLAYIIDRVLYDAVTRSPAFYLDDI